MPFLRWCERNPILALIFVCVAADVIIETAPHIAKNMWILLAGVILGVACAYAAFSLNKAKSADRGES